MVAIQNSEESGKQPITMTESLHPEFGNECDQNPVRDNSVGNTLESYPLTLVPNNRHALLINYTTFDTFVICG